jgi:ParB/RepB/Spo0J family partition protein
MSDEGLLKKGLHEVPVDRLHPHRLHRAAPAGEYDRPLVESIRADGILSPLIVRTDGTILAGKRRWEAAKALGLAAVPCRVVGLSDDELVTFAQSQSVFRVPVKPVEYARQLRKLLDSRAVTIPELARKIGRSEDWICDRLRLLDLVPEVATVVDADDSPVNLKTALKIAKLPAGDQVEALRVVLALAASDREKGRPAVDDFCRRYAGAPWVDRALNGFLSDLTEHGRSEAPTQLYRQGLREKVEWLVRHCEPPCTLGEIDDFLTDYLTP